jgi:hypothetical protein
MNAINDEKHGNKVLNHESKINPHATGLVLD